MLDFSTHICEYSTNYTYNWVIILCTLNKASSWPNERNLRNILGGYGSNNTNCISSMMALNAFSYVAKWSYPCPHYGHVCIVIRLITLMGLRFNDSIEFIYIGWTTRHLSSQNIMMWPYMHVSSLCISLTWHHSSSHTSHSCHTHTWIFVSYAYV